MKRIQKAFEAAVSSEKPLLNIYLTAGYPHKASTGPLLKTLSRAGVDFIEVGMPYSDPLADGETIQASSSVALQNGITLTEIFNQIAEVRSDVRPPIILMGYYNQVLRYGKDNFIADCKRAGVNGLILPDLPLDIYEQEFRDDLIANDLGISFLVTPRTPAERIHKIDGLCRGFLYVVSSSSTTGSKQDALAESDAYFQRLKDLNLNSPMLIGFNISTPEALQHTRKFARGGIIGSAFIRALNAEHPEKSAEKFVQWVKSL